MKRDELVPYGGLVTEEERYVYFDPLSFKVWDEGMTRQLKKDLL